MDLMEEILTAIKTKWIGFYVAAVAWVLTFVQMITYSQIGGIEEGLFSAGVIISCVCGLLFFVMFSLLRKTSPLAPIILMICDLLCLMFFVGASGFQDYFSTQFFDGFSMSKLFSLGVPVWFSMLSFILSFVISSVAIYLPQNRKPKIKNVNSTPADGNTVR